MRYGLGFWLYSSSSADVSAIGSEGAKPDQMGAEVVVDFERVMNCRSQEGSEAVWKEYGRLNLWDKKNWSSVSVK